MRNLKRALALGLSIICALTSSVSSNTFYALAANSKAVDGWNESVSADSAKSYSDLSMWQTYFSGDEWKGITSNGVNWTNIYEVNREDAHSSETIPYDSVEKAKEGAINYTPEISDYYKLITGKGNDWQLAVYKNMTDAENAGVAGNFYKTSYNMNSAPKYSGNNTVGTYDTAYYGGFKTVTLPASWQTQGFDFPIYTNIAYPWPGVYGNSNDSVPVAPTVTNPVGFYRYYLDVDASWMAENRKVFISFQGVESAMYLYVNGHEVGYSEDSFDAAEFDITPFLNSNGKDNLIAVKVVRWCDGSWLEDQDFLRLAGIFRDVYVYSTPSVYLEDYKVETDLDNNYVNANLSLDIDLKNMSINNTADKSMAVDVKIFDADGNNIFANNPLIGTFQTVNSGQKTTVSLDRTVIAPHLWSEEDPYLYTMVITLYNSRTGAYYESISQQLGFREITFTKTVVDQNYNNITSKYEQVLINGQKFKFRGTDRHDVNLLAGRYVTKELYEKDIFLMKQFNINAIRTSHYPNDKYLYYLCDKYGLYVMAECNVEAHGIDSDDMGRYLEVPIRDRLYTHMNIEKNRTSVVMWSFGNESGETPTTKVIQKSINEVMKRQDSTRPIHYCGLGGQGGTDVDSQMYAGIDGVYVKGMTSNNMPYLQCEYAHAMGNSVGHLYEYWEAYRSADNILGAFVWDWVDQSIATEIPGMSNINVIKADQTSNDFTGTYDGYIMNDSGSPNGKAYYGNSLFSQAADKDAGSKLNKVLSGNNSFTIETWVNQGNNSNYNTIFAKGDYQVALRTAGDRITFYVYNGTWVQNDFEMPANWLNTWHNLAAIVDGQNMYVYCDGVKLNSLSSNLITAPINATDKAFGIGYDVDNLGSRDGNNKYAYFRVYSRALSANEISAQMNADRGWGAYAVPVTDSSVVMWLDYSKASTSSVPGDYYDYYGEKGIDEYAGKYFAYGGCWGDVINSDNFCQNGLVGADRSVQDELYEVKYVYQKFWFEADEIDIRNKKVSVYNESSFTNLSAYDVVYELLEDGEVIDKGKVNVDCAPFNETTFTVPYKLPKDKIDGAEYYLTLKVLLKEDKDWAKKGHDIAYEQFRVPVEVAEVAEPVHNENISYSDNGSMLTLSGNNFELKLNKTTGLIENYKYAGNTVMTEGPTPNYWRGLYDNDEKESSVLNTAYIWEDANSTMTVDSINSYVVENGKAYRVDVVYNIGRVNNSKQKMSYIVYGSGEIKVTSELELSQDAPQLIRYGAEITLPEDYENITWYGNGPFETISDRERSGLMGLYESTVSDSFYPYPNPQASGNKTDVRFMALESESNPIGLMVVSASEMQASALHYKTSDYNDVRTTYKLPRTDYTVLNVDYGAKGTGGATCGPGTMEKYKLLNDGRDYSYTYTIVPYEKSKYGDELVPLSKQYRNVAYFSEEVFDKDVAANVTSLIAKLEFISSYVQKADVQAARTEYERLTNEQKALVTNYDVLVNAENYIETYKDSKEYIVDKSRYSRNIEITNSAVIYKDTTSPVGYSFTGGFGVPDSNGVVNSTLSGNANFTIETWVNPSDLDGDNGFVMKGDYQVSIKTTNNGLEYYIYGGGWQVLEVPFVQAGLKVNVWNHIAATYDGSYMRLYVNGVEVGNKAISVSINSVGYELGIGKNMDPAHVSKRLRGKMASTHVYNTALSANQIAARYNEDLGNGNSGITANSSSVVLWCDANSYNIQFANGTDAVNNVISAIASLPNADDITTNDADEVNRVKDLYDSLSAEQKNKVGNISKLEDLIEKIASFDDTNVSASEGIKVVGYQISTSLGGNRVVGSVEPEIDGKKVKNWGLIYGLSTVDGKDYGVRDEDMLVDSDNKYVIAYESTEKGTINEKMGDSETATYFVRTMLFTAYTEQYFNAQYKIRAYAVLEDGSYVYSDVAGYSIKSVADYLYTNRMMRSDADHQYLYEKILMVADPKYKPVEYEEDMVVIKPEQVG